MMEAVRRTVHRDYPVIQLQSLDELMNNISPLGILLDVMRTKWREGEIDKAVALARAAAPFVHARPGKTIRKTTIEQDICHLSDAELGGEIAATRARIETSDLRPVELA